MHHHEEASVVADYLIHGGISTVITLGGAYVAKFCNHMGHRILLGASFIVVETIATVQLVG